MAFHVVYRAAQGQQFAQVNGGGYLLDQMKYGQVSGPSTGYPNEIPIGLIPQVDVTDFGSSILSDVEPSSTGAPSFKVGRITMAFNTSQVSTTASNPTFNINRVRAGVAATMGTFNLTATGFPTIWGPVHLTGTQISNGNLIQGDMVVVSIASNGTGQVPLPAFTVLLDIEG